MRLHILGIGGTFMAGIALLAKASGHEVSGSDGRLYPPMSTQLDTAGITLFEGYEAGLLKRLGKIDLFIVGNVIKRGNALLEEILAQHLPFVSGPAWLANTILHDKRVIAVAGTHGKTTTTSMLAFILDRVGIECGFLVGGVPENFGVSARVGNSQYFVIEADEYDSAFFDKRPKFMHYSPQIAILNNLEYDHADIYPDLQAIQQQFHYLIRTIPNNGRIIYPAHDAALQEVLQKGCWSPVVTFGTGVGDWRATLNRPDGSELTVFHQGECVGQVSWQLIGQHNVSNALAAIAAAYEAGVSPLQSMQSLPYFTNVKRRMELKGRVKDIAVYDDFAHHPTAIATTLQGLRAKIGKEARLIAVLEFGSYTMRQGVHRDALPQALHDADQIIFKNTETDWGLENVAKSCRQPTQIFNDVNQLVNALANTLFPGDHVIMMSNKGFDGVHEKLLERLSA